MLGAALAASLLLTGCTQDVIIHTSSGVVNIGEVTSEQASLKMTGLVEGKLYDLGTYPIAEVNSVIEASWGVDQTAMLEKDMDLQLDTVVAYTGTKTSATVIVNRTHIQCPKGFMWGTCASLIQNTQAGLVQTYKEKFSYLK